jgi:hypothetical protein
MTQDMQFLLFAVLLCDPHDFVVGNQKVGHLSSGRCEELEEFLRIGNNLGIWPVVRFRQLAPQPVKTQFR